MNFCVEWLVGVVLLRPILSQSSSSEDIFHTPERAHAAFFPYTALQQEHNSRFNKKFSFYPTAPTHGAPFFSRFFGFLSSGGGGGGGQCAHTLCDHTYTYIHTYVYSSGALPIGQLCV